MLLMQGQGGQKFVIAGEKKKLHSKSGGGTSNAREPLSPRANNAPVDISDISAEVPVLPPPKAGKWVLRAEGGGAEQALPTADANPVWVGRWKERVRIFLDDGGQPSKASRLHAKLSYSQSSFLWSVVDNKSANGTFVNGERVPPDGAVELHEGDRLCFGSVPAAEGGASAPADDPSMPRFHFVVRLVRPVAARELANAPEIDFTAKLPAGGAPTAETESVAAAAPADAPADAADAVEHASAFEAGEKATLLTLLGCMRSQLKVAQGALKAAHAQRDASSAHQAINAINAHLIVSELGEADRDIGMLAASMEAAAGAHARALATVRDELSRAEAPPAATAPTVEAPEAGLTKADLLPSKATVKTAESAVNPLDAQPTILLGGAEALTPGSLMSSFDLSRRLMELSPGGTPAPGGTTADTPRSGSVAPAHGGDIIADSGETVLLPPLASSVHLASTPTQLATPSAAKRVVYVRRPIVPDSSATADVAAPSELAPPVTALVAELESARSQLSSAVAAASASNEALHAATARAETAEAAAARATRDLVTAREEGRMAAHAELESVRDALHGAKQAARAAAISAAASSDEAERVAREADELREQLARRKKEDAAVIDGTEEQKSRADEVARASDAAVADALEAARIVHARELDEARAAAASAAASEHEEKLVEAEAARAAAEELAAQERTARLVAESTLEEAAAQRANEASGMVLRAEAEEIAADVARAHAAALDAATVAAAAAHQTELASLRAQLQAAEERAAAAEAVGLAASLASSGIPSFFGAHAESARRDLAAAGGSSLGGGSGGNGGGEGAPMQPAPTEPVSIAPMAEPDQPMTVGSDKEATPPRKARSSRGSPSQHHTPVSAGGNAQKPGLLRRWGFLFRTPK